MDNTSTIIAVFIIVCAVLGLLVLLSRLIIGLIQACVLNISASGHYLRQQLLPTDIEKTLTANVQYFRNLTVAEKSRFIKRVKSFMDEKEFIGREKLVVTDEMRTMISASAVQITFGLEKYTFHHFSKIIIYPKPYYSRLTQKYHAGDVNLAGVIAFSWEDFEFGYKKQDDNYNVGLHEMAHALRFSTIKPEEFDRFFTYYFDKWSAVAMDEFKRIRHHEHSVLREYAGTNINEFFAVCTEYFFESPGLILEKLPDLYKQMCILLNQNPLETNLSSVSVRSKTLVHPVVSFENQMPLIKTGISIFDIFSISINITTLVIILFSNMAHTAIANSILYLPALIVLILLIYFYTTEVIHAFPNGIRIKHFINLFREPKNMSYEEVISVTFTKNKVSDLLIVRYLENEVITTNSFPYSFNDKEVVAFVKVLMEKKIAVLNPPVLITAPQEKKEKGTS
ncbi:MAG TPA: zinc-dependent peptidase [Bacteroidia bacterium]